MKFDMATVCTLLLNGILVVLSSCNGQSTSASEGATRSNGNGIFPLGDTLVVFPEKGIMVVFEDKKHNHWFANWDGGVYKYDGVHLVLFTSRDGLCSDAILGMQEDESGNVYFDTPDGVSKFDGREFTTLEVLNNAGVEEDWKLEPGDLWFRMGWNSNGPYRYDGSSLRQLPFPKHPLEDEFHSKFPKVSYSPYGIYSIYRDSNGAMWFGTSNLGACRFDGKSFAWISEEEVTELDDGPSNGVRSIVEDKDGNYWFSNVFHRYEVKPGSSKDRKDQPISYRMKKGIEVSDPFNTNDLTYYMSAVKDNNDDLWMVTYSAGVWRYDGDKLEHYSVEAGDARVTLFSIYKDRQGVLWLGTHNNGVYRFNGENFERFNPNIN